MLHRGIRCLAPAGLAVLAAAVCILAPNLAAARDFGGSAVRYVEAPSPFEADLASTPAAVDPIGLGSLYRGSKLKLSLAPVASVAPFNGGDTQMGGFEVRLGSGAKAASPPDGSWFVFAGAKGRKVHWDMSRSAYDAEDYVQTGRRAKIGDLRAGVVYQMGAAQMALGYMKRTYRSGDLTDKQSYAAFTIVFRR